MFDFLTKLGNRWYFNIRLTQEIERNKRGNYSVCVAAIDVDNFKQINDQMGHYAGDAVLVNISNIFRKYTRNLDVVSRWGGDEFVIIFPDTDMGSSLEITNKLKDVVLASEECGIATLSIGVVVINKDWDKKSTKFGWIYFFNIQCTIKCKSEQFQHTCFVLIVWEKTFFILL